MFEMLIWNKAIVFTEIHISNFYSTSQRDKQEETTHRPNDRKWLTDPDFLQKANNVRLSPGSGSRSGHDFKPGLRRTFDTASVWTLNPTEDLPGSVTTRRVIDRSVEHHLFLLFT